MPVTIRTECKAFVDQYEPVIIALLAKQIDPDKICQTLGLCEKSFELSVKSEPQLPIMKAIEIVILKKTFCIQIFKLLNNFYSNYRKRVLNASFANSPWEQLLSF